MKKILILTAGYGEGHNAAARGIRDALARIAPETRVEMRDLFAENFGRFHELVRRTYLFVVNRMPRAWGLVYRWLDRRDKAAFEKDFAGFRKLKRRFATLLNEFQPDAIVSVFPAYPYLYQHLRESLNPSHVHPQNIAVVTDSITVNAIWYRSEADYFVVPNEQSAAVVRAGGIAPEKIKILGFPVNPKFADLADGVGAPLRRPLPPGPPKLLYMINAGTSSAPDLVGRLLDLPIELTVTVGRNDNLRRRIEAVKNGRPLEILGWTDQMPRILSESHLLIGKAGGATVQETIAARCPMLINHIVSGQEEGNAQLLVETNSGAVAHDAHEVVAKVQEIFANDAKQWRDWEKNISQLSRPRASLDIAEFLLSLQPPLA